MEDTFFWHRKRTFQNGVVAIVDKVIELCLNTSMDVDG